MDPESRMEKPIWGTVREVMSCELVDELAPREYITMRPSHDISHTRYLLYGKTVTSAVKKTNIPCLV